jgi:hypothetical protein
MSLLTGVLITGVCVAVAALLVVLFRQRAEDKALLEHQIETLRRQSAETGRAQTDALTQHLLKMTSEVNRQLESVGPAGQESQKSVGDRLDSATRVVGEVQKGFGRPGPGVGTDFGDWERHLGLQNILKAPKLRGGLGEFLSCRLALSNSAAPKRDVSAHLSKPGKQWTRSFVWAAGWCPWTPSFPWKISAK